MFGVVVIVATKEQYLGALIEIRAPTAGKVGPLKLMFCIEGIVAL